MKPISLKFAAFGPFVEEQFIDFSKLEKSGLFLISGDTGSGKTTILDAMTIALYFRSSNGAKFGTSASDTFERMRCKQAPNNKPTFVEFIFESGGKKYKFERSYTFKTKNFDSAQNCYVWDNGKYIQLVDNSNRIEDINRMAVRVTGLTAEQFRQVVILPQGKFETLLTSESKEKEPILTGIFNAEKWDRITGIISKKVSEEGKRIESEESTIRGTLEYFGCADTEELAEAIKAKELEAAEAEKSEKVLREEYDKLSREHDSVVALSGEFRELDERNTKKDRLALKLKNAGNEKRALALSEEALKLKPVYDKKTESDKKLSEEQTVLRTAAAALEKSKKALGSAESAKAAHDAKKAGIDEGFARIPVLEKSRGDYETIDEKKSAFDTSIKQYGAAVKTQTETEKKYNEADASFKAIREAFRAADETLKSARKAYDANISGILALELKDGDECPVCGSRVHPRKAPLADETVTKDRLNRLKAAREAAEADYNSAQEKTEKYKAELEKAKEISADKKLALAGAESELNNARKGMIEGINSLEELNNKISALRKAKEAFDTEGKETEEKLSAAVGAKAGREADFKSAEERCNALLEENKKLSAEWHEKLSASSFGSEQDYSAALISQEEIDGRRKAMTETETQYKEAVKSCEEKASELKGKERPDVAAHSKLLNDKKAGHVKALSDLNTLRPLIEKMKRTAESLSERCAELRKAKDRNAANSKFAESIGNGKGMNIKRYILGIMLDLVIGQANATLSSIYGGRYRLIKSEKMKNNKASGLDFEIFDLNCGSSRPAADISGGEKFLVSLSLAIGLSDVVRAQAKGANLEAIFIDEGFGTLDKDCLNDALFVLESIKKNHGMVGVISHVDELGESITAGIKAVKTAEGSICEISYE